MPGSRSKLQVAMELMTKEKIMTPTTDGQTSQPIPGTYDDVLEIRECRAAEANDLLAAGWTLQGVYNWSQRVESKKTNEQSYVRRAVLYVLLRRR
jgi:hypothetical protein